MIDWCVPMGATLLSTAAACGPGVDSRGRFGLMAYTSLRLRLGSLHEEDDLDPAESIATIHRIRTGAA